MAFSLMHLIESGLLVTDAGAILSERRVLHKCDIGNRLHDNTQGKSRTTMVMME